MAPARKSRTNKRYTGASLYSPEKDVGTSTKTKQRGVASFSPDKNAGTSNKNTQRKKKISDKLGPQWSKEDLERFYDAYRKHGRDWKKVASAVRNRNADMVEALYSMNRAYLSLPEGTASVIGLIAMMTDHYNVLEGSDSDYESTDAPALHRKSQKTKRGKDQLNNSRDIFQSYSVNSADGCLSSWLKRKRSDVTQPRVVGKRTPRFPVQQQRKDFMDSYASPSKKSRKPENDNEDEVAHAALALAEASQRAGSPQVSTPYRRQEHVSPSPAQSWERLGHAHYEKTARSRDAYRDEDWLEGSVGSRGAESGEYTKDSSSILEGVGGTAEKYRKERILYRKQENVEDDDGGEACSGTEGLNVSSVKGKVDVEVSNTKKERFSPQSQRKRSNKLFFGDESSAFDALQTLANLSLMLPPCTMESESSVQLKEERILDYEDKFNEPEATSSSQVRSRNKFFGAKQKASQIVVSGNEYTVSKKSKIGRDSAVEINSVPTTEGQPCTDTKVWKRKRKPYTPKTLGTEAHVDSPLSEAVKTEVNLEEEAKPLIKGKRSCQTYTPSKQWKSNRSSEGSMSSDHRRASPGADLLGATAQVPASSQDNIPPKRRSRRKMHLPQAFYPKEMKSFDNLPVQKITRHRGSTKEKISSCLSSYLVRRWCTFEWFYSAIDYPWFSKREFEEYLNHVGLGHIPRLTRVEWGVIRSSLGKPRRFSEHFLREERDKLRQYRESVRKHYTELRTGVRDGLPTDLAKPITVGQRVIALHPRTREVHDGSVLTVDHDKCRIQFDSPEIGVEFVMDVDCMPLNPLDNMPEVIRRQKSFAPRKFSLLTKEPQINGNLNLSGPMTSLLSAHLDKAPTPMNTMGMQGMGDNIHTISQLKAAAIDIVNAPPGAYDNYFAPNSHVREADVRAISELTRALDKKETLLIELRKTHDEVSENQNNGDYSLRASEPFMKHYATVLVQLKEASGQVSSALLDLRQRNNHPGNALFPWLKAPASSGAHCGLPGSDSFSTSLDSGSSVVQIVNGSTLKAQAMVKAAIKAFSSIKQGEDAYAKIREALDSIDSKLMTSESRKLSTRPHEQVNGHLAHHNQPISCATEPESTIDSTVPSLHMDPNKNEVQIPSEVITSCVATLLMIQTCTERQYPPADVAQILDSAVTSLNPCCPQNIQIYREIQTYMGRIKTQILALVPT